MQPSIEIFVDGPPKEGGIMAYECFTLQHNEPDKVTFYGWTSRRLPSQYTDKVLVEPHQLQELVNYFEPQGVRVRLW